MTTYTETSSRSTAGWPMYAALGAGIAIVLSAMGTFWDATGNDGKGADDSLSSYLVVVGIIAVATALVFGLVVRGAAAGNAARRGLVLAVLSVLSLVVFWSGLPPVLAAGGFACAMLARDSGTAKAAMGISAVTIALSVVLAVIG